MVGRRGRMLKQVKAWIASWLVLFLTWFLFVAKLSWQELLVGIGASTLATIGFQIVSIRSVTKFDPQIKWILQIWRVPWLILHDYWLVVRHLFSQLFLRRGKPGTFRAIRFPSGADDAQSAARRVLAITYSTLSPNSIIIDIDQKAGLMLIHQLEKEEPPELLKHLGAQ